MVTHEVDDWTILRLDDLLHYDAAPASDCAASLGAHR
jgi:hypothetical protein